MRACLDHIQHLLDQPVLVLVDLVVDDLPLRLFVFYVVFVLLCFVLLCFVFVGCAPAP